MAKIRGRRIYHTVRKYMPDLIYGANDGLVTTFAIVSGVVGARLPALVVVILGFANVIADGFSMGASNFLALRSRIEDGEQRLPTGAALRHGLATFTSFVLLGSLPLLAYVVPMPGGWRFPLAAALTLAILFSVGAARSAVSELRWLRSGLEMLFVGAVAAGVAYGLGALISGLTSGSGGLAGAG
ncbi:MAG: VIT1/CCC1 transporter family protein [Phycisphaeraceae bacterium]